MAKRILAIALLLMPFPGFTQNRGDSTEIRALARLLKEKRYWATHPDSMLLLSSEGLRKAESVGDLFGAAEMHKFLGIYEWTVGNYAKAIEHYTYAKKKFDELGKQFQAAQVLANLGMVYSKLSDHEKALQFYQQALRIMEKQRDPDLLSLAATTSSIGLILRNHGNSDEAIKMFRSSLHNYSRLADSLNLAGTLTNMATVFLRMGNYDSAMFLNQRASDIFRRLRNNRGLAIAYNNLGTAAASARDYRSAADYFKKAYDVNTGGSFFDSQIASLIGLGEANLALRHLEESRSNYLEAMSIAERKNRARLIEIYKGLADCFREMNKPGLALEYLQKHIALKDSIYNVENSGVIANLRISYDVEQKNAAIALLERDSKISRLTRNMTMAIAAAGSLIFGVLLLVIQTRRRRDKNLQKKELEMHEMRRLAAEQELEGRKIREAELRDQLEFRNRALTTYTLNLVQKNGMLEEVKAVIQEVLKEKNANEAELKKLIKLIDYSFTLDKDWDGFKTYFENVHPDFFKKLKESYPSLSATELKLCALIRLSLSIKESATVLGISPDSVKVSRHRIRKKLGLSTDNNLTEFILSV